MAILGSSTGTGTGVRLHRNLRDSGIVEVRLVAQKRVYQLQAQSFQELGAWVDTFRQVWG